jgi:hypothetical protein
MQDQNWKLEVTDNRDNMEKADMRWASISEYVMKKTRSDEGASYYRDKDACRDKWQGIYGDYEELIPKERANAGLPRHFSPYYYQLIHSFCKDSPNVELPHARDSSGPY